MTDFAHLHLHSSYSMVDGLINPGDLPTHAAGRGISALALTDLCNLFGFVGFYKAAEKAGVKPICGLEIPLATGRGDIANIVLLALNDKGYRNLLKLVSRAYTDKGFETAPERTALLHRDWLKGNTEGLAALSCGQPGEIGRLLLAGHHRQAGEVLENTRELFDGNFYIEVDRLQREHEEEYLEAAVNLSARTGCPLVATNDVRFLKPADFETHEARVCVTARELLNNPTRPRLYRPSQYLTSAEEMRALFSDLPEAVDNALRLAKRCNLKMEFDRLHMPSLKLPEGQSEADWLRDKAFSGLKSRFKGAELGQDYRQRLEYELDVIERTGFISYFSVVSEIIVWAKDNGVRVGPGRGSGAGALVSWALGITELDPLQHGLLFERFLNPERVSPPDLDIDFDPVGRNRVIEHVVETHGREVVAQIATMDFSHARGAIRDSARVLGHPLGLAHRMCELLPSDPTQQLSVVEAEAQLPQLKEMAEEDAVREILDLAHGLEGLPQNVSRHAGGVVIAPDDLTNYAPLFRAATDTWVATQYDKKDLEAVGLVKFDFLGLVTLSIIDEALELANERRALDGKPPIGRDDMSWDDPQPYKLLARGETEALFQLESPRMRSLVQRFAPARFSDIVALLALIRPGPLEANMFDQAVKCRSGEEELNPPHELLREVVSDTWGVMLYQEQIMEAARRLADYSYGEADELRRAMGTKDRDEMARHESIFVERAVAKGIQNNSARKVFQLMAKFAGYGFNKSHSASYAVLSFQTAWLKAHYRACFMAATLTHEFHATKRERRWRLISACRHTGLKVLPPDVNTSQPAFSVAAEDEIRFGLAAIDGLGELPARAIVQARERGGPFASLYDLCLRAELHRWDQRILEALNDAGALRGLEPNGARALELIPAARLYAQQRTRERETNQGGLFGAEVESAAPDPGAVATDSTEPLKAWTPTEMSLRERQVLGVFLAHHPVSGWRRELDRMGYFRHSPQRRIAEMSGAGETLNLIVRVHGVTELRRRSSTLCLVALDDETGSCEAEAPPQMVEQEPPLFDKDELLLVRLKITPAEGGRLRPRLQILKAKRLEDIRREKTRNLLIRIDGDIPAGHWCEMEKQGGTGDCPVIFRCRFEGLEGDLSLPEDLHRKPDQESLEHLRQLFGANSVEFEYNE